MQMKSSMVERICLVCGETFMARACVVARGGGKYCSHHCQQQRHGTHAEQLAAKLDTSGACWLWTGFLSPTGYGYISNTKVHRLAYELAYGPIPGDLHVLHTCDVRNCCNPAHLFLGTQQANVTDMWGKGRAAPHHGEHNGRARLTADDVRAIRSRHAVGEITQAALAREYGVTATTINAIVTRQRWEHVT